MKETARNIEKIYKGRMFSIEKHDVVLDDGSEDIRELVINCGGAGIVALDSDDNIILVRQFRYGIQDMLLEIPAGKLSEGEDPMECAVRELREETGMIASGAKHLLSYYASAAYLTEKMNIYYSDDISEGDPEPDPGEFVEVVKMPFDKAVDMVIKGEIQDGKTQMAVMKTAMLRKRQQAFR